MEKNELNEALKISGDISMLYYIVCYLMSLKGFNVSPAMLNGIFLRFAKRRSFLNFDDFVSCLANLKLAVGM